MAPPKINDSSVQARLAAEAARRRAEAEARRRAEEAKRRAEEAKRQAEQLKQQMKALKDEVSTGKGTAFKTKALTLTGANANQGTPVTQGTLVSAKDLIRSGGKLPLDRAAGATTLATEDVNDAKVNCLDKAVDFTNALPPEQRKNAELVVLQDTRTGTEGTTGHVVVRQGDAITDPSSGKTYASSKEFYEANPQYREAGVVKADDAKRIFDTKAGSPERAQALADAKIPEQLKTMMLADATGYSPAQADADAKKIHEAVDGLGTDEDAIYKTLEGKTPEQIEQMRQSYTRQFGGSMDEDLRGDFVGDEKINKLLKGTEAAPTWKDPAADAERIAKEADPKKAAADLEAAFKANTDPAYRAELVKNLGPTLPELAKKVDGLGDDDARAVLGTLSRAAEAAGPEAGQPLLDALKESEKVKAGLTALGLGPDSLSGGKGAALLGAAGCAATGKHIEALGYLGRAYQAAPEGDREVIRAAVVSLAQKIPDAGVGAIFKGVLTNPDTVKTLLDNGGAIDKLGQGDVGGALKDLLSDPATQAGVAGAILANPTAQAFLAKLGITSPEQVIALKDTVGQLVDASDKFANGDFAGGFKLAGAALLAMPPEVRKTALAGLLDAIPGLPPKAKTLLMGAEDILLNPDVAGKLGEAFTAMKAGDGAGFVTKLGEAVVAAGTTETGKQLQLKMLERFSKMDGPVGKFFSDPTLNKALVESGAINKATEALAALARGDIGAAVDHLGQILPTLAGAGEHINALGVELPFSQEGLENVGRFFGRVLDVLPDGVKKKIAEKGAALAARAGAKAVPILGNVVSAWDALSGIPDVVGAISKGNGLEIALTAGQFVLDAAGVVPALGSAVAPIRAAVGTVSALHEILGAKETAEEIKAAFDAYTA